jgi:capsular polysaccharide biosynthesis protein/Mrp family chromosome partitioning ATPase
VELTGYLAVARRWWWTLLVATWVAGVSGFLVASRITPTYESQVQLLVGPINTDIDTLKASGQLVQTYAQLAISTPLLKSTAQEFPGIDPIKLGQAVRTTASDVTRVLQLRVQDSDPNRAAQIANTMGDELIQLTTGATTRPEGQLEVISSALPAATPIAPQVSLIVLLAMVAGLLGGLVLVIIVEYATDTVRDRADLGRLAPSDVLATIAFDPRTPGAGLPVAQATAPNSASAVAFRMLAAKVAFAEAERPTRTILVAGVGDGDSAVVASGIAAAVAGSGYRAVIIDASSEGDITQSLGIADRRGLREIVAQGGNDIASALVYGPAGTEVLPRGVEGNADLIAVDRARTLLDGLLADVDLVVIDGGALQRSAGALSWARAAQESILLVRRGTSRRSEVRLAVESLQFVGANIGGTVLIQRAPGLSFRRSRSASRRASGQSAAYPVVASPSRPASSGGSFATRPIVPERAEARQFAVEPAAPTIVRTSGRASEADASGTRGTSSDASPSRRSSSAKSVDEDRIIPRGTPRSRRAE